MPKRAPIHRPLRAGGRSLRLPQRNRQATRALRTNSAEWLDIRAEQLAREPLCRAHAKRGMVRAANEVDHVDGDDSNSDPSNLQSLCKPCHSSKTNREQGGFGNRKRQ